MDIDNINQEIAWHTSCLSSSFVFFYYFEFFFNFMYMNFVFVDIADWQTSKQTSVGPPKKIAKVAPDVCVQTLYVEEDVKTKLAEELSKIRMAESQEVKEREPVHLSACHSTSEDGEADWILPSHAYEKPVGLQEPQEKGLYSF